ncbi:universal stress protein [Paucilactobacillus suebicus]|uniref:Universal stress protein n=1 Tax=Paucilactobacillus suebicus DSM 5007 = KCTC 3549 TaxID=1423807 RepID=A0A0R1W672_9LACO|nr:universal stress protein [Paucilactobacillus suebicus]KRM13053.1 UspA family nucleotide-binding protein [Paucilactobacillus suebicus DSM 5007 = KCTC 3549]
MEKYRKILVGVDGSSQSKQALKRAIQVAKDFHAELLIASVQNDAKFTNMGFGSSVVNKTSPTVITEAKHQLVLFLNQCEQLASEQGVQVDAVMAHGSAKKELAVTIPEKYQTDLIVVGATGLNRVEQMIIGSTASYIIEHTQTDVLIVRTE